jgi:hypothetical protein
VREEVETKSYAQEQPWSQPKNRDRVQAAARLRRAEVALDDSHELKPETLPERTIDPEPPPRERSVTDADLRLPHPLRLPFQLALSASASLAISMTAGEAPS